MEVASFDVADATTILHRRWKTLFGATIAAAILGALVAALVPKLWESEVDIEVGMAYGRPLEDSRVLARFLASDAYRRMLPDQLISGIRDPIGSQVVEVGSDSEPVYIRVLARGRTSQQATAL